jgi:uncharacterized protein YdeI (BOF family)
MILRYVTLILAVVCVLGLTGCGLSKPSALGLPVMQGPITQIASLKPSPKPYTIEGTMIDKCPVAGCWFHVKDSTGVIKVDTKSSGFVVVDVPINAKVVVTGVLHNDGEEKLAASGITYQ